MHAGLVCIDGPDGMDLDMHIEAFLAVLDALEREPDLVNQVLEATIERDGAPDIELRRYDLPAAGGASARIWRVPRKRRAAGSGSAG